MRKTPANVHLRAGDDDISSGSLGWHLKRSCFSLNDAALLDFPMADDEASSSSMTLSRKSADALNTIGMTRFVDFDKFVTGRRLSGGVTPPYASADALSESELSELEERVARGDFAVTSRDLTNMCFAVENSCSPFMNNEKNWTRELNSESMVTNATTAIENDQLEQNEELKTEIESHKLEYSVDNNITECLHAKSIQTPSTASATARIPSSWMTLDGVPLTRCISMPSLKFTKALISPLTCPPLADLTIMQKPQALMLPSNHPLNVDYDCTQDNLFARAEYLDHVMTRSFTTETTNRFIYGCDTSTAESTMRQRRILPLRPDEKLCNGENENYLRQSYQQRIFIPSLKQQLQPVNLQDQQQLGLVPVTEFVPAERQHQHQAKRRLPEVPKIDLANTTAADVYNANYSQKNNENESNVTIVKNDCIECADTEGVEKLLEPQQLINILRVNSTIGKTTRASAHQKHSHYDTSISSKLATQPCHTPEFNECRLYDHTLQRRCNEPGDEYQLSYGIDVSQMRTSADLIACDDDSDMYSDFISKDSLYYDLRRRSNTTNYGIMDGSYYEDDAIVRPSGLLADLPQPSSSTVATNVASNAEDSQHRYFCEMPRKHSGSNLTDGENSSGISSCCTSSSTMAGSGVVNSGIVKSTSRDYMHSYYNQSQIDNAEDEKSDNQRPTHRAQFAFIPRHADEVQLEVGDAIHVDRTEEDHWCYGINLRTTKRGIFPSAHICAIDLVDEICQVALAQASNFSVPSKQERDTFYLTMLASVEVAHHKGNDVLVQAINKVCSMYQEKDEVLVPQTVLVEISFRGVHVIDKRKKNFFRCPTFDFFYSLQNISFCGAHPKQLRYFGFITKHPLLPRFACHVFLSQESTQPIVESIGRAFKRSYDEYMAFAHPTEDIFIE